MKTYFFLGGCGPKPPGVLHTLAKVYQVFELLSNRHAQLGVTYILVPDLRPPNEFGV